MEDDAARTRRRRRRRWAWGTFIGLVMAVSIAATIYGLMHAAALRDLRPQTDSASRGGPAPAVPAPAPPAPRVRGKLLGVNVHPLWRGVTQRDHGPLLDLVQRSGANSVRIDVGWASLEPGRPGQLGAVYTQRTDAFIRAANARGIAVVVMLSGTPCWASTAPETLRQGCAGKWWERGVQAYPPRDPADYARAARTVALRWGDRIAGLEIWNEPNDPFFWRSVDPARDYGRMLRLAYDAVKTVRPRLDVVGGAIAYADGAFLRRLYRDGGIAGHYDAISFHPYTNGTLPAARRARGTGLKYTFRDGTRWMRQIMRHAGDPNPRLWFTEVGASTCPPKLAGGICVTPQRQARYVEQAVRLARGLEDVDAIFVYSLVDAGADPRDPASAYGLASRDGTPKPAFYAFRRAVASPPEGALSSARR